MDILSIIFSLVSLPVLPFYLTSQYIVRTSHEGKFQLRVRCPWEMMARLCCVYLPFFFHFFFKVITSVWLSSSLLPSQKCSGGHKDDFHLEPPNCVVHVSPGVRGRKLVRDQRQKRKSWDRCHSVLLKDMLSGREYGCLIGRKPSRRMGIHNYTSSLVPPCIYIYWTLSGHTRAHFLNWYF